jgi:hypothetical protein
MFDKPRIQLIIALCTSCTLIAFAVYRRHHSVPIPGIAFYVTAALICVIGEVYARSRHKTCRTKSPIR